MKTKPKKKKRINEKKVLSTVYLFFNFIFEKMYVFIEILMLGGSISDTLYLENNSEHL